MGKEERGINIKAIFKNSIGFAKPLLPEPGIFSVLFWRKNKIRQDESPTNNKT
jgi:hypothetical protein